jgi:hypothetical protein
MNEFARYKYSDDNDIIYELGEHHLYYPIIFCKAEDKRCARGVKAKTKLEYIKEHNLELYIELVQNDSLSSYIDFYLDRLEKETVSIYSKMEVQDAMGRLMAEEIARENLL